MLLISQVMFNLYSFKAITVNYPAIETTVFWTFWGINYSDFIQICTENKLNNLELFKSNLSWRKTHNRFQQLIFIKENKRKTEREITTFCALLEH